MRFYENRKIAFSWRAEKANLRKPKKFAFSSLPENRIFGIRKIVLMAPRKRGFIGKRRISFSWRPRKVICWKTKKSHFLGAQKKRYFEIRNITSLMTFRNSDFLVNEKIYFSWRLEKAIFRKPKIVIPKDKKKSLFHWVLINRLFCKQKIAF